MSTLNALQVAIEVAQRQRDGARQALLDLQRIAQAGQAQLDQLRQYAQETEQRWGMRAGAAVQPEVMHHHYQFMARLEHTMGLQADIVQAQGQRVAQARQVLMQAELRVQSLQKVLQRKQQEQALAQQRREQKQTDERASLRLVSPYSTSRTSPLGQEV